MNEITYKITMVKDLAMGLGTGLETQEVQGEPVGKHFAFRDVSDIGYYDVRYAIDHVKTGYCAGWTTSKDKARKTIKVLDSLNIDWDADLSVIGKQILDNYPCIGTDMAIDGLTYWPPSQLEQRVDELKLVGWKHTCYNPKAHH